MANLILARGNAIIFQLLRRNLAGKDAAASQWEEVKVVSMAVLPSAVTYSMRSRTQVNQTGERTAFVEKFGMEFQHVTITGTFGSAPRRSGLSLKDGYTRLQEFKNEIVRKSSRVNDELDQKEAKRVIGKQRADANARYVYAVNYYDFIYNEMFAVDIKSFITSLDARRNPYLPEYQLALDEIGDTIKVESKDGMLRVLLATNELLSGAEGLIDDAVGAITDNSIFQTLDLGIAGIDQLSFQAANISGLIASYSSAITAVGAGVSKALGGSKGISASKLASIKG